jgi:hypothetical protein
MNHFGRSIRRGARRFQSQGGPEGVSHVGYRNPDGSRAVVLTNLGPERSVPLRLGAMTATALLGADSLTTVTWR